MQVKKN